MKGLFIGGYPNPVEPYKSVFFKQLIEQMADLGVECHVISNVSVTKHRGRIRRIPDKTIDYTAKGNKIFVYYPKTMSFSAKKIGRWNTMSLTQAFCDKTVMRAYEQLHIKFDFVYGHFFLSGGLVAAQIARKDNIPAYVAYGECDFESEIASKYTIKDGQLDGVKGIISVSTKNENDIKKRSFAKGIKTLLSINAVDDTKFYVKDRLQCRRELGMPEKDFIVGFVGYFIERKGSDRLLKACEGLEGVSLAFAGKGGNEPTGENVVFCKSLEHKDVCTFLNAIDVFALPTLNEGCSNAIIEAMTCNNAIISSDLPFNTDILNLDNSILIDPLDIEQLRVAITTLRDDVALRLRLANNALERSKDLSLAKRAENILTFIRETSEG